jgi:phosphohistidine phosphatase
VRHAKAISKSVDLPDKERPLLFKGETNTRFITNYLYRNNISVSLIITSQAIRALETAKIFAETLNHPEDKIKIEKEIYNSGKKALLKQFDNIPDTEKSVLIIGHNPSITKFVNYFIEDKIGNLPGSGLICLGFEMKRWEDITKTKPKELFRIFPRTVKGMIKSGALIN